MANDSEWVEDIKRWYFSGRERAGVNADAAPALSPLVDRFQDDAAPLGYEAAHPVLQAHHWPDVLGFADGMGKPAY